jgi:alpha-amylase
MKHMNSVEYPIDTRHLVLCFQVHQPRRLKKLAAADPAVETSWLDEKLDQAIMERIAKDCYIPANTLLLRLIEQYPQIRISFSISGTAIEQMEAYTPEVIESFRALAATGSVDFLSETYHHSLAFLMEGEEFEIQILEHAEKIYEHFGVRPSVFRNTNFIYNDDIGRRLAMMGFRGVLMEGNVHAIRTCPHHLYEHRDFNGLKILMRNQNLSDDIAFRVALSGWNLTAEKYMSWLEAMPENEKLVVVAIDYETFGEHHKADTKIFHFLEHMLLLIAIENSYEMSTPAEIVQYKAAQAISIPDHVAVAGCDLSDWVGNQKQRDAFSALTALESGVKAKNDAAMLRLWRCLQASDHFYYMSDKTDHAIRLSPYASSQDAYDQYMTVIHSLQNRIQTGAGAAAETEKINEAVEAERRNINAPLWALNIDSRSGYNR